jgi:hypothetical protein
VISAAAPLLQLPPHEQHKAGSAHGQGQAAQIKTADIAEADQGVGCSFNFLEHVRFGRCGQSVGIGA